jgi:transposase
MTRLRGRARRHRRLMAWAPFGHWRTQTFVAALRGDGLTAPWVIDWQMNREMFDLWVETQLAPTPEAGDVVILDNLAAHRSEKSKTTLEQRGAWFLFLPPDSPDLNPIEMAFAKLKVHLRRIGGDLAVPADGELPALTGGVAVPKHERLRPVRRHPHAEALQPGIPEPRLAVRRDRQSVHLALADHHRGLALAGHPLTLALISPAVGGASGEHDCAHNGQRASQ